MRRKRLKVCLCQRKLEAAFLGILSQLLKGEAKRVRLPSARSPVLLISLRAHLAVQRYPRSIVDSPVSLDDLGDNAFSYYSFMA